MKTKKNKELQMNTPTQKKLRAKEVAKIYGIGVSTVWHYAKLGLITPIKITYKVTVFDVKELDSFFNVN